MILNETGKRGVYLKIDRLVSIIMILLDKKRVGAQELAEKFEVSQRTIYRDIEAINQAGIPVRTFPGVGGGFEIMPDYKIDQKFFSTTELSNILMGLSGISDVMHSKEIVYALEKVKSLVPEEKIDDVVVRMNQIYIDLNPWMGNRNIRLHLQTIKDALQESKLLTFQYIGRKGDSIARTVEPYQLVLKGNHWYVYAFCHMREAFRLFKLSRMAELQMSEEVFQPKEYDKPQLNMEEMNWPKYTEITLRIHKSIMEQILDYCPFEQFTPEGEEHYIVEFPFIANEYYYNQLLGFGDKCECLAPVSVREEIKRRIQKIVDLYQ